MENLVRGDYLGGWCLLVLGGSHLTFNSLNASNLPKNPPVVNISHSLVTYHLRTNYDTCFNPIQDGLFGAAHGWGRGGRIPP